MSASAQNSKYGRTVEYQATNTSQYISSMMFWAQQQLASSSATYTVVAAHFPMFGGKIQNGDTTLIYGTGTPAKGALPVYPGNFNWRARAPLAAGLAPLAGALAAAAPALPRRRQSWRLADIPRRRKRPAASRT